MWRSNCSEFPEVLILEELELWLNQDQEELNSRCAKGNQQMLMQENDVKRVRMDLALLGYKTRVSSRQWWWPCSTAVLPHPQGRRPRPVEPWDLDSVASYLHCFSYPYIPMMKCTWWIRHSNRLTTTIINRTILTTYHNKSYVNVVAPSQNILLNLPPRGVARWHSACVMRWGRGGT